LSGTANKNDERYISALENIQLKYESYGSHHGGKTTRKRRRRTRKI
jgi:hypothetical protein